MAKNDKTNAIFGLHKVPDSFFLKQANQEIGQLKAYIDELEDKLETQTEADKRAAKIEAKKSELYKNQKQTIQTLTQRVKSLREVNNTLFSRLAKYEQNH